VVPTAIPKSEEELEVLFLLLGLDQPFWVITIYRVTFEIGVFVPTLRIVKLLIEPRSIWR
jgi:hypothetical protein